MARGSWITIALLVCSVLFIVGPSPLSEWYGQGIHEGRVQSRRMKGSNDVAAHVDEDKGTVEESHHGQEAEEGSESHHGEEEEGHHGEEGEGSEGDHGEEGEGHHGEEGEEEGGAEEVFEPKNMVCVMLFIFMFLDVFLVYVIYFRDADVRSAIYTMISATMSIFVAVTINVAAFSFFIDQVLKGDGWIHLFGSVYWPRGLSTWSWFRHLSAQWGCWLEFYVSCFLLLFCIIGVSVGCTVTKENELQMYAVRIIGGHLTAFAGIITFATLQLRAEKTGFLAHHHFVTVGIAIVVIMVLRTLVGFVRNWKREKRLATLLLGQHAGQDGDNEGDMLVVRTETMSEQKKVDGEVQEAINEAENDAFALIISFLFTQLVIWEVTDHLMPLHAPEHHQKAHTLKDIKMMGMYLAGSVGVLTLFTGFQSNWFGYAVFGQNVWDQAWFCNLRSVVNQILVMTTSWLSLFTVTWLTQLGLSTYLIPLDSHEMAEVVSAIVLTILAVGFTIALDQAVDRITEHRKGNKDFKEKQKRSDSDIVDAEHEKSKFVVDSVRKIIEACGMLVGLCWEKACHAAITTTIESIPLFEAHQVQSKIGAAVILTVIILPAWMWHIVPMAKKSVADHEVTIDLNLIIRMHQEGKLKKDGQDGRKFHQLINEFKKFAKVYKDKHKDDGFLSS